MLLDLALSEDLGAGDVTSSALIPQRAQATARVEARQALRLCGVPVVEEVFAGVDPDLEFSSEEPEGADVEAGPLLRVRGSLRSILAAERTALNFLGRLCGIATLTRRYVEAVGELPCRVVDTRKTLPGWRALDKYATSVGGAENHRFGLYDALLLKDNHLAFAGGAAAAFRVAREHAPSHLRIQVEVESEADAASAVAAGADWLLLDNCPIDVLSSVAARFGDRVLLEASGGITLETVREVAATGVHRVSVGALTHSAPAADVALELDEIEA
jgi:nicotinate-nucleotide pyrophosphorylase (carboxylating)